MENKSTCKNCVHFVNDNLSNNRKSEMPLTGFGYCTNHKVRIAKDYWGDPKSGSFDGIVVSDYIGRLSDHHAANGVYANFLVGEDFGCIHFKY